MYEITVANWPSTLQWSQGLYPVDVDIDRYADVAVMNSFKKPQQSCTERDRSAKINNNGNLMNKSEDGNMLLDI